MTAVRAWPRLPVRQDAILATVLLLLCVLVNVVGTPLVEGPPGQLVFWWAATALATLAVTLRRWRPLPMLACCLLSVGVHIAQVAPLTIIDLSLLVLLYTVATRHARAASLAVLAALLLLATAWSLLYDPRPMLGPSAVLSTGPVPSVLKEGMTVHRSASADSWVGLSALGSALVASWAIGSGARNRRAYLDELHAHARDLERERDQQAALAVAAERARISRELHDVVAHGLSLMVVQAQGGAAALDHDPTGTRTALDAIVTTGRASLADMRRVLTAVGEVADAWHPQPGLAHLSALIAQVNRAGTSVRLRVEGAPPATLPSAVDLSAYRIVQEALTNTMKHAGTGATASVVLAYQDTEIGIEISDDGHGPAVGTGVGDHRTAIGTGVGDHRTGADIGGGNGLRGMRERVKLLGGTFSAGPGSQGGFAVRAALPVGGDAA